MSIDGTQPEYGVKTCGKRAELPFTELLGPCLLEPGHEDRCEFHAPGLPDGRIRVSKVEQIPLDEALQRHPWYSDEEVRRWRRISKRSMRMSFAVLAFNVLALIWTLLQVFDVV
jgi:hypothetical protein